MAENQIQRVSVKHDAILDYMLIHPAEKLGDVARHFQVSPPWLSVIIHSDVFQAKLARKDSQQFGAIVVPLREQLMGITSLGVEKLGECLEKASPTSDKQFIADTTDSLLKNLGYSPRANAPTPAPGNTSMTQNNYFVADKEALANARDKMRTVPDTGNLPEAPTGLEGEVIENGTASTEV